MLTKILIQIRYLGTRRHRLVAMVSLSFLFVSSGMAYSAVSDGSHISTVLTTEERAWLAENHRVRVRVTDWPPYSIREPVPSGISVDYLNTIARRFGFKVEFASPSLDWTESIQDVTGPRRHFDLLPHMFRTPEREKEFALTVDYLSAPWVIYTRNDSPYIAGPESLSGKTVASEKGFVITDKLKADYPSIHILEVKRTQEALEAVATGLADAYVGNLAIANYLIKAHHLNNLVVAAPTHFGLHHQAMGIRNDWPALVTLINKGLAAMTAEEIEAINQKWGAVEVRPRKDYTLVWRISIGALLVCLVFFYWNRRLSREIAIRRRIEVELRESESALNEEKHRLQQAQQALQHLNETLEDQVRLRTMELESSNAFNETILNASPFPIGVYADTGDCVFVNDAYAELVGATREALLRQNFNNVSAWKKYGLLDDCLAALEQGSRRQRDIHLFSLSDKEIWGVALILPTDLNGKPHLLIQFIDLTSRKEMEERLRLSEERHRLLADNSFDVIWTMGLDGRFTYVSPSVEKLRGYTPAEVMQQSMEEVLTPESIALVEEGIKNMVASVQSGKPVEAFRGLIEQPCKDGSTVWTEVTTSPICRSDGSFVELLGVTRDTTDRLRYEKELEQARITAETAGQYRRSRQVTDIPDS